MAAKERVGNLTISEFNRYLDETQRDLDVCYQEIEEVQYQFNDIFKRELAGWQEQFAFCYPRVAVARAQGQLPPAFAQLIDRVEAEERARIEKEIAELDRQIEENQRKADDLLATAQGATGALRNANPEVNEREEQLKALMVQYQDEYARAFEEAEALERPFLGWLTNAAKLRKLNQIQRNAKKQQAETLQKLRQVRQDWIKQLQEAGEKQAELRQSWQQLQVQIAEAKTRRTHLSDNLPALAEQAALQRVLEELTEAPAIPGELGTALQDLVRRTGVRKSYEMGLRTVAEILGLTKGVGEGLKRFRRSVGTVLQEQRRYGLKEVRVPISAFVAGMNGTWKELQAKVKDEKYLGTHPLEFSRTVDAYIKQRLTDANIQQLFEDMGAALNKATSAWK